MAKHHQNLYHKGRKKDYSNRFCLLCNSNITGKNNKGCFNWYKFNNGFICSKCYNRNRYKKLVSK